MTFQSTVQFERGFGVPGDMFLSGPTRAQPAILHSADAAYNIVGATAFTVETGGTDGDPNQPITAKAGGTGIFAGLLVDPKAYSANGTLGGGSLAPTLTLPNYTNAELALMGTFIVTLPNTANIGDPVVYDTTTGEISTVPAANAFTGVIATNTGVDTLTVSGAATGSAIGLGSVITGVGIPFGTFVKSLGTGTGGNGTYVLSTSGLTVSSEAMSATGAPGTGKAFAGNFKVDRYTVTAAGLAVVTGTN